jgi:CHAT domain-containing protein
MLPGAAAEQRLDAALHRLHRALAPLLGHVRERYASVAVVALGHLGNVPVHAAWCDCGAERGPYVGRVGREVATTYLPSVDVGGVLAERERERTHSDRLADFPPDVRRRFLLIDNPSPSTLPAGDAGRVQAALLAELFKSPQFMRLTGPDATRERILPALGKADVAHLCCHGTMDVGGALLHLADNVTLGVTDVMDIKSSGRLVFLSACNASFRGAHLSNEAHHLPGGFLRAGFSGVISSSWTVPALSSTLLVLAFYDVWRQGFPPDEALRNAQSFVRDATNAEKRARLWRMASETSPEARELASWLGPDECVDHAHPVYWAGFHLTGV